MRLVNSQGFTKEYIERVYKDKVPKKVKKSINKHIHWLSTTRLCKICKEKIPYSFVDEEIEKELYGLPKM